MFLLFDYVSIKCCNFNRHFESLAVNILQSCYEADDTNTRKTLTRKIKEFDNCTAMQLAVSAYNLNVIAHQSFQNVLKEIWYFKIMPDTKKFRVRLHVLIMTKGFLT